jgi:hypothetical protein
MGATVLADPRAADLASQLLALTTGASVEYGAGESTAIAFGTDSED